LRLAIFFFRTVGMTLIKHEGDECVSQDKFCDRLKVRRAFRLLDLINCNMCSVQRNHQSASLRAVEELILQNCVTCHLQKSWVTTNA